MVENDSIINVKPRSSRTQSRSSVFQWAMFVILIIYTVSLALPILWGIINSLKSRSDFVSNIFGLPKKWMFDNYIHSFERFKVRIKTGLGTRDVFLAEMILNTLTYIAGSIIVSTFVPCIVGYLVARYRFRFNKLLHALVIFEMLVPIVGTTPSMLRLLHALGIYNTYFSIWLMKANFTGMSFLVYYGMFKLISREYSEAAFIDGASHTRVMFTIMFPLLKTIIGIFALMNFIHLWNEYQVPMLYIPAYPTVAFGLFIYSRSSLNSSVPDQLTGCMILIIPTLIAFLLFHDKMIGNLTMGGLKG